MPKKKKKKAKKKKASKRSKKADKLLADIPIEKIKKELGEEGKEEDYDKEEIVRMFEAEDEDESETTTEDTDAFDEEGQEEY